jgi:hypothetical protein
LARVHVWVALACMAALAGCASHGGRYASAPRRDYTAPGPEGDPWGPYIREASLRYRVPETWIRQVMRQESGGHAYLNGRPTTSWAGAAGLMQVMPATYEGLRQRYGLGDDPYDPHDNIAAGAAYIREMYDKYGSPGFLAAYNAGPRRMDDYLAGASALPDETVNYVAAIAPRLGRETPLSGPLAVYADNAAAAPRPIPVALAPAARPRGEIVDPESFVPTYVVPVPDETPTAVAAAEPPPPPAAAPDVVPPVRSALGWSGRYYTPSSPGPSFSAPVLKVAQVAPALTQTAVPGPERAVGFRLVRAYPPGIEAARPPSSGLWAVQVGAFATPMQAREAAEHARALAQGTAGSAQPAIGAVTRPGGGALFRARLAGLTETAARESCRVLRGDGIACIPVPPDGA